MIGADKINEILESLTPEASAKLMVDLENLITGSQRKASVKRVKSPSASSVKVKINKTCQTVQKKDILKHFSEINLSSLTSTPPSTIKADFVALCEMLASLEDDRAERDKWRRQAVKVVMIDRSEDLISYITTVALGIRI
jgi:hypothetical protein